MAIKVAIANMETAKVFDLIPIFLIILIFPRLIIILLTKIVIV
jgi:hypothetical protein